MKFRRKTHNRVQKMSWVLFHKWGQKYFHPRRPELSFWLHFNVFTSIALTHWHLFLWGFLTFHICDILNVNSDTPPKYIIKDVPQSQDSRMGHIGVMGTCVSKLCRHRRTRLHRIESHLNCKVQGLGSPSRMNTIPRPLNLRLRRGGTNHREKGR